MVRNRFYTERAVSDTSQQKITLCRHSILDICKAPNENETKIAYTLGLLESLPNDEILPLLTVNKIQPDLSLGQAIAANYTSTKELLNMQRYLSLLQQLLLNKTPATDILNLLKISSGYNENIGMLIASKQITNSYPNAIAAQQQDTSITIQYLNLLDFLLQTGIPAKTILGFMQAKNAQQKNFRRLLQENKENSTHQKCDALLKRWEQIEESPLLAFLESGVGLGLGIGK